MELSDEQSNAYTQFLEGKNIFITGPGGTGKSMLIRKMVDHMNMRNMKYQVCAMTGCAAVLLKCKARTLHSWTGIGLANGTMRKVIDKALSNKYACKNWKNTQVLIVDEISMMSKKLFDIIESIARLVRNQRHLPFGGLQIIFCGDFYQLPPVGNESEPETMQFCFESERWDTVFPKENVIELKKIFRQEDEEYQKILNEVRVGEISDESYEKLCTCVGREIPKEIESVPVKMYPTRAQVDYVNRIMYEKLDEEEQIYECEIDTNFTTYIDSGKLIEMEVMNCMQKIPNEIIENEVRNLMNNVHIIKELKLKIGTKVMCVQNLDIDGGICNGSCGVIIRFENRIEDNGKTEKKRYPLVRYQNGRERLMVGEKVQSEEMPRVVCSQIPLIKSWAVTIHKMQGSSIEKSELELGNRIFEYGQIYVGISRVKSMNGLYIVDLNRDKIKSNEKVKEYYVKIGVI